MEQHTPEAAATRPTLLTVLCILTFIGSGWGILSNLNSYRHAGLSSEAVSTVLDSAQSQIRKDAPEGPSADIADRMLSGAREMADPFKIRKSALFGLVACMLTLGGGFLMFQMRKPGFWVYLLGTGISVVAPFAVFGTDNIIGILMGSGSGLVGVIFCVLYAVNLKHMR
jgi:hypothetical protein